MTVREEITCFRNDISIMKEEIKWIKQIGYYISGIMTLQLVAIIATKV